MRHARDASRIISKFLAGATAGEMLVSLTEGSKTEERTLKAKIAMSVWGYVEFQVPVGWMKSYKELGVWVWNRGIKIWTRSMT